LLSPSPGVQRRLGDLLRGVEFSDEHQGLLAASTQLRGEPLPNEGFGTNLCCVEPAYLLEGQILVILGRGFTWADAKPLAFYQVVELQPVRLRRIMGDASTPVNIRLTAAPAVWAMNGLGVAECVKLHAQGGLLRHRPFVAARDSRKPAGSSSAPLPRSRGILRERDGSDEEETTRAPSYRKLEDKKTSNTLAAILIVRTHKPFHIYGS